MSTKRSVILQGGDNVVYNEEGAASAQVKPGYLVKGVSAIAHQTGTGKVPAAFAVERDELGAGIDNTYQTSGTISAFYASGDTVKVAVCPAGTILTAFLASGQSATEDGMLASNGAGLLTASSDDDDVVCRSLETLATVAVATAIRVQVV